jgi:hypothetical protein
MNAKITKRSSDKMIIQVEIPIDEKSMLESEEMIQESLNEAGTLATKEVLERFDADGDPIEIGEVKFTSKGKVEKEYQCPYGSVRVNRNVYQSSRGGATYCPLDKDSRIVTSSTPRFAKMISSKYAEGGAAQVLKDLKETHKRKVARSFIKNVTDAVGAIATAKEESWRYKIPQLDTPVKTVSIGLDGTCMYIVDEKYREAMVGTVALYDRKGKRLHTTYLAATPEHGKEKFISRFEREVERAKKLYPKANYVGIADGASDNWTFLAKHTTTQTIDFYHATEYIAKAADAIYGQPEGKEEKAEKTNWQDETCHNLKHKHRSAAKILSEFRKEKIADLSEERKKKLKSAITYFTNHKHQMKYASNIENNLPIGSGVTEAACKVIVKQRLCKSGMKWKDKGAQAVLSLRALKYSDGRWDQFWSKINQHGIPSAA